MHTQVEMFISLFSEEHGGKNHPQAKQKICHIKKDHERLRSEMVRKGQKWIEKVVKQRCYCLKLPLIQLRFNTFSLVGLSKTSPSV